MTDTALADFCAARYADGAAPSTLSTYMACVSGMAKAGGLANPVGPHTRAVLAGMRRQNAERSDGNAGRGQAFGLSYDDVTLLCRHESALGTLTALRNATLLSVMSDALLRVSEAVALTVADVSIEGDGTGSVLLRRSKTDQEGLGAVLHLKQRSARLITRYATAGDLTSGPLFRRMRRGDTLTASGLTPHSARRIIQSVFTRWQAYTSSEGASARVTGHSLRIGTAQTLVRLGASLPELQQAGRWSSARMPAHYTRRERASRSAVARLLPD